MVLLKSVTVAVLGVLVLAAALGLWFAVLLRPRRRREPGFACVFVEDDGSARELEADERDALGAEYPPGDGGRPYVKLRYESRTPDGRLGGYLLRRRLPRHLPIRPARS